MVARFFHFTDMLHMHGVLILKTRQKSSQFSPLLPLRKRPNDVRNGVVLALSSTWPQIDLIPRTSLQKPLVRWPADVAAIKEMWPDDIDSA